MWPFNKRIYETMVLCENYIGINKKLLELQKDGWEIAGVFRTEQSCISGLVLIVPLKRKIK